MITYERPTSRAARWARRLARLSLGVLVLAFAAHRFGSLSTTSFVSLVLLSAAMASVGLLLAVVGLVRLWQVAAVAGIASVVAILYALTPLAVAAIGLAAYEANPALTEVTTDLANPPPFIRPRPMEAGWLASAPPVAVQKQAQAEAYPGLTGRRYDGAVDRVLAGVRTVADMTGTRIVAEEGLENAEPDFEDLAMQPDTDPGARGAREGATGKSPRKGPARDPAPVPPGAVPVPSSRPQPGAAPLAPGRRATDILLQDESRSRIFGFRFDLVIRLREDAETTFVDIRVASRVGRHDLGFSARTAERFLHALDAELLGIAGD